MSIIVQIIDIEWTKKSRGAPQATLRNSVPESLPFGKHDLGQGVFVQSIRYSEIDAFTDPVVKKPRLVNEQKQREMKLGFVNDQNIVEVSTWGIPLRNEHGKEKLVGTLNESMWLRIIGNVRVSLEHTWAYHKYVYNIYYGKAVIFDEVVQKTKPQTIYRDEVNLW